MTTATTTVNTTANAAPGGYMARIRAIVPSASTTKKVHSTRNIKRDTIEDARKKVADKLRANKAWAIGMVNSEKPDLVYKEQADGTYEVGVKYGNRYLEDIFDGAGALAGISKEQLGPLLEQLACDAEAGQFDAQIRKIMQANVSARNKDTH